MVDVAYLPFLVVDGMVNLSIGSCPSFGGGAMSPYRSLSRDHELHRTVAMSYCENNNNMLPIRRRSSFTGQLQTQKG